MGKSTAEPNISSLAASKIDTLTGEEIYGAMSRKMRGKKKKITPLDIK